MARFQIHQSTYFVENMIRRVCDETPLSDEVTCDVLESYTRIGLCMVDLLGTLYNRDHDDFSQLTLRHEDVIRPLWAALMYFSAPRDQKWIWKDEAMSMVVPFSIFAEAAEAMMFPPESVGLDGIDQAAGEDFGYETPDDGDDD